ncbi:MAG: hypothetical protein ACJAY8_000866 [Sphingobacteriales bacterium]|jgi:hypothetical protein
MYKLIGVKTFFFSIFLSLFLGSCRVSDSHEIKDNPKFTGLDYCRVDKYVFDGEALTSPCQEASLVVLENVLKLGDSESAEFGRYFGMFKDNPDWKTVQKEVIATFGDLKEEKQRLNSFFAKYSSIFDEEMPLVVFYNGGFNYGVYPDKAFLGIGLEWFLGTGSTIYPRLAPENFPMYRILQMVPERLVPQAVFGYLSFHQFDPKGGRFVDLAMAHGKLLYLAGLMLENTPTELFLGFTSEKWQWTEDHEYQIWKELVKGELLYSSSVEVHRQFFTDGPFTPGFPKESAPNLGMYIGYKMVVDFMLDNPDVSPNELLNLEVKDIIKYYNPK